jgi:hypothetical protein
MTVPGLVYKGSVLEFELKLIEDIKTLCDYDDTIITGSFLVEEVVIPVESDDLRQMVEDAQEVFFTSGDSLKCHCS